jgi:hypothetical protein
MQGQEASVRFMCREESMSITSTVHMRMQFNYIKNGAN